MLTSEEFDRIAADGFVDVECSNACGEGRRIEPDESYPCDCGGRFISPLITEGLI